MQKSLPASGDQRVSAHGKGEPASGCGNDRGRI